MGTQEGSASKGKGRRGSASRTHDTGTITVRRLRVLKRKSRSRVIVPTLVVVSLIAVSIIVMFQPGASAEDYTFGSEDVIKGISVDAGNRDVEDGNYQQLIEEDQYDDTNFTGSSENVVTGTTGGSFPDDLNTENDQYRTYVEEDTGGAPPASYELFLFPDGDVQTEWTDFPDGNSYEAVDETTEGSDEDTTYIWTDTDDNEDRFSLADIGDPGTGYTLDVQVFGVHTKKAAQPCDVTIGIRIGSSNYQGFSLNPSNGAYVNTSSTVWMLNPSTTSEWTFAEVDALSVYVLSDDADPYPRVSQVGIKVLVNFTGSTNYELDARITYSSVTSTSQTTGYRLLLEAKRSSTENFAVSLYNYTSIDWDLVATVQDGTDTDYSVDLNSDQRDGTGNEVIVRFEDLITASDGDQDTLSIDLCKIMRIEEGYALDVTMTAAATNQYGNQTLKVKGYTSTEDFYVGIYNYTAVGWDEQILTVTALSNTLYTYDLRSDHRSGQEVKVNFTDSTAEASDQTQDTLYLDWVIVSWNHSDPTITLYGSDSPKNAGSTISLWANYTDIDNEAPSYMQVNISGTEYDMIKNITDTSYWDGVSYYYDTGAMSAGIYDYNFTTKDANSGIITTSTEQLTINGAPTLTNYGHTPETGNNGDTFYFFCNYTDLYSNDAPDYIEVVIEGTPYTMTKNDSGDSSYDNGVNYSYDKVMAAGDYQYYFRTADYLSAEVTTSTEDLTVNNIPTLSGGTREPTDPVYVDTTLNFNVTFTDIDGDLPDDIRWREDGGTTQNESMSEVDAGDSDTTNGKDYTYSTTLGHGEHTFDFYADDGNGTVSGEGDTVTIANRAPTIDNDPGEPSTYRNTYWDYDFEATDPDTDTLVWEMSSNATFLEINSASGLVYGTTSDPVAWYRTTVWANDSYSGSDSLMFCLNVTNRAPVISSAGNTTQTNNTFMSYNIQATDDDSDVMTYEFSSNCSDLSIDNHWVNGTVTEIGWYDCHVWVNDSYGGSDYENWQLTVTEAAENNAPYFTSTPIYSVANNTFYSYDSNATDADGDTLWYNVTTNCTELSTHHGMGYVNGTPVGIGYYYVNITVWDTNISGGNLSAHQNYSLTLTNRLPEITSSAVLTGTVGVAYSYDVEATDENDDTLVYDFYYKNATWLFIDDETGLVEGTPTTAGWFIINISVSDPFGGVDYQNYTLTISEAGGEPGPSPGYITEDDLETCMFGLIIGMIAVMVYVMMTKRKRRKGKGSENKRVKSG